MGTKAQKSTLRAVREAHGGLREFARRNDLDPSELSRIERGVRIPTVPVLVKLCDALGLKDTADAIRRIVPRKFP